MPKLSGIPESADHHDANHGRRVLPALRSFLAPNLRFFVFSSILLFFLLLSTRILLIEYSHFRLKADSDVLHLLNQKNMPLRPEENQVIISAVLSLTRDLVEPPCGNNGSGPQNACGQLHSLQQAFLHLSLISDIGSTNQTVFCHPECRQLERSGDATCTRIKPDLSKSAQAVCRRVSAEIDASFQALGLPPDNELCQAWRVQAYEWARNLLVVQKYSRKSLQDCTLATTGAPQYLFSTPQCDSQPQSYTKLLIPSQLAPYMDSSQDRFAKALLDANALSLFLEPLVKAYLQYVEPSQAAASGTSRIVQMYFISPLSLFRYWDVHHQEPLQVFSGYRIWGDYAFLRFPLVEAENQHMSSPSFEYSGSLKTQLSVPYIDYGKYGLVRTECVGLWRSDPAGSGILCIDYTVPIRFPKAHRKSTSLPRMPTNGLFSYQLLSVDRQAAFGSRCIETMKAQSPLVRDKGPILSILQNCLRRLSWKPLDESTDASLNSFRTDGTGAAICQGANSGKERFFEAVQPLSTTAQSPSTVFWVPLHSGGDEPGSEYLGMVLTPDPTRPPRLSLASTAVFLILFCLLLALRIYYEKSDRLKSRQDSILRDLQAGVIVTRNNVVEEANDRAEEFFNTALRTLGSRRDLADPVELSNLLEDTVLFRPSQGDSDGSSLLTPQLMTLDKVESYRRAGIAFAYYAKLKKRVPAVARGWIRIRGNPIFPSDRGHSENRTFAVMHAVSKETVSEIERDIENLRRPRNGAV